MLPAQGQARKLEVLGCPSLAEAQNGLFFPWTTKVPGWGPSKGNDTLFLLPNKQLHVCRLPSRHLGCLEGGTFFLITAHKAPSWQEALEPSSERHLLYTQNKRGRIYKGNQRLVRAKLTFPLNSESPWRGGQGRSRDAKLSFCLRDSLFTKSPSLPRGKDLGSHQAPACA